MTIKNPTIANKVISRNLFIQALILLLMLVIFSGSASADSIRCGTNLITDGLKPGPSKIQVKRKCGEPYSESGNRWVYVKGRSVYRLRFSDVSGLVSIRREIER